MAAEFPSQQAPNVRGGVVVSERVYVDSDGNRVAAGSTAPKRLYAKPGMTLSESEARRLGVTDSGVPDDEPATSTSEDDEADESPGEDEEPEPEDESYTCAECGFVAKSAAGLGAHQRTHEDDE